MKRHTPVIGDDAAQVDRRWKELISEVKKSGSPAASKALKQWLFRYCFEVTESYTLRDPTDVLHQLEALISEVKRLPPCDSIERELPGEVGFQLFDPLDALKLPELPEPQARAPLKYHEETLGHRTPFVGGSPEARFREEENRRLRRR